MLREHTLVLDAGTSRVRCHVFDRNGQNVASSVRAWQYAQEPDAPELARSFDSPHLWQGICNIIQKTCSKAEIAPGDIEVIAVTSQRQGIAFLGEGDEDIYLGPNTDLRAVFEGAALDQDYREQIYQTTGHTPSFLFAPAKLKWFQAHHPDTYAKISCVLGLGDWLAWKLTGIKANEVSLASEMGLLDISKVEWCNPLLAGLGLCQIDTSVVEAAQVIGEVSKESSEATGLTQGTSVVIAGADTQCGLVGLGACEVGQIGIVAGWSVPLQMVTEQPVLSPQCKTWAGCHAIPGKWVLESNAGDVGNAYQWVANNLFAGEDNPFEKMNRLAENISVGSEAALAFFGSQKMDMSHVGMKVGGFFFPTPMAVSNFGRGHLVRAALESIACCIRANMEQVEELSGHKASYISVGGGMTRTKSFVNILPNVLNREILVSDNPDVTAIGAYLCARTAMGDYETLEQASHSVRSKLKTLLPNPVEAMEYQDYYERWLEVSEKLQEIGF